MTGIEDRVFASVASTSFRRSGQSSRTSSARNTTREVGVGGQYQHQYNHQYHSLRKQASVASTRSAWKLKYQDFTLPATEEEWNPRSEVGNSDAFQQLVTKANEWLRQNTTVRVRTSEAVTWMSPDPKELNNSKRMTISRRMGEGAKTFYRRGLRLWLVPQHPAKSQETLCFEDFLPEFNDRISDLAEKINNRIEKRQLRGRIVSVQTVDAPHRHGKIENSSTEWMDEADRDSRYVFFLRVFYILTDANVHQESVKNMLKLVGVRDFVPEETGNGYEAFETLIDGANTWMKNQTDVVSVANMQTVIVQKQGSSGTGHCGYVIPGVNSTESTEFLRILRVAYLRRKSFSTASSTDFFSNIPPISYETVTPQMISTAEQSQTQRLETMRETFGKVVSLLRSTDAEIVCAETVANPVHLYSDEDTEETQSSDDVIRFMLTVRLYLRRSTGVTSTTHVTGVEDEAGGGRREVNKGRRSSPLFLGSVVTRQFKYRWLVLAVSAFTCMAIIVVVSVVYSNK